MLHARPRCRGVDQGSSPGVGGTQQLKSSSGVVGGAQQFKSSSGVGGAQQFKSSPGVGDARRTLSVAGGYNRCVRLLVSNGVAIPFGGGQPTAPFDDCLIGVAPCGDGFGLPTTCSF